VTRRATKRGEERTPLEGERADVLVCGASFAGLAVARELAGSEADVLVLDRYEIGERATSACAAPTPWLHAMGVEASIRQELPYMAFTTPHGSVRYRLPWSWSSFDYRTLCELLWAQAGEARFETAKVEGLAPGAADGELAVRTDRGVVRAPLVVDALGWRRVLDAPGYQPPAAPLSRGLEVHPPVEGPPARGGLGGHAAADLARPPQSQELAANSARPPPVAIATRSPRFSGAALDVWVERSLVRRGYGWRVPAGDEARIGVGSYEPRDHVREPTQALAARLHADPVRYQGNWFPHRLRAATAGAVFFAGDSAGHCFPLSGEGIRTAFYFGIACGRELAAVVAGRATREQALERYAAFHERHAPAFRRALRLQRLIPALPPRALTVLLRAIAPQPIVDRAFGWYLEQAHPAFARAPAGGGGHLSSAARRPATTPSA
jgi:flavin-dependent dehydrogenase